MRYLLKLFLVAVMLFGNAHAAITDLKLSTAQIFDVQWYVSGGRLYASSFNYIYASVNYATQTTSAARWTAAQTADAGSNGRYIAFFNSTTNPGTYGMAVYNSDGTRYKIINNTGSFRALADGAIFYNGNGMWGTLITTGQGYTNGSSGNWAVTQDYPTNTQLQAYVPPTTVPLASGQTATQANDSLSSGGGSSAPAWPATSDITTNESTQKTAATGRVSNITVGNSVSIDQKIGSSNNSVTIEQTGTYNKISGLAGANYAILSGSNNNINIKQGDTLGKNLIEFTVIGSSNTLTVFQARDSTTGLRDGAESGGHYLGLSVSGNTNSISVKQNNLGGANSSHFAYIDVTGNNNQGSLKQTDNGSKTLFSAINGSQNIFDIVQQGAGSFLDLSLTGNSNNVTVSQKESGYHKATINLTNAGGPTTATLVQQGGTPQNINITQQCATLSGCSVSVTQGP